MLRFQMVKCVQQQIQIKMVLYIGGTKYYPSYTNQQINKYQSTEKIN